MANYLIPVHPLDYFQLKFDGWLQNPARSSRYPSDGTTTTTAIPPWRPTTQKTPLAPANLPRLPSRHIATQPSLQGSPPIPACNPGSLPARAPGTVNPHRC